MHRREHKTSWIVHFPSLLRLHNFSNPFLPSFLPSNPNRDPRRRDTSREIPFPRILSRFFAPSGCNDGRRYSRWFSPRPRIYGPTLLERNALSLPPSFPLSLSTVPFSLAAYIILPIEVHTSFPLYVSIYNRPRNICSSRSRGRDGRLEGRAAWAGEWTRLGFEYSPRNWCTATDEQCLVPRTTGKRCLGPSPRAPSQQSLPREARSLREITTRAFLFYLGGDWIDDARIFNFCSSCRLLSSIRELVEFGGLEVIETIRLIFNLGRTCFLFRCWDWRCEKFGTIYLIIFVSGFFLQERVEIRVQRTLED